MGGEECEREEKRLRRIQVDLVCLSSLRRVGFRSGSRSGYRYGLFRHLCPLQQIVGFLSYGEWNILIKLKIIVKVQMA